MSEQDVPPPPKSKQEEEARIKAELAQLERDIAAGTGPSREPGLHSTPVTERADNNGHKVPASRPAGEHEQDPGFDNATRDIEDKQGEKQN